MKSARSADVLQSLERGFVHGVSWVAAASFLVGGINYGFALTMTALLDAPAYSVFAGGQALLLIGGSAATASIPWVVASELASGRADRHHRMDVLRFAVLANGALGGVAGVVTGLIATRFADILTSVVVGGATALIFWASTTVGWLQGHERFRAIAVVRVSEVVAKAVAGLSLVLVGAGAAGALGGFTVGAAAVIAYGVAIAREDSGNARPVRPGRGMWSRAAGIGGIQTLIAMSVSLGSVVVVLLSRDLIAAANYQVAALLGRVPSFLAGTVALVVFPLLSKANTDGSAALTGRAIRAYLGLVTPFALALATVPDAILEGIFPSYRDLERVLPMLVVTGVLIGIMALLATAHQAAARFGQTTSRLAAAGLLQIAGLWGGWAVAGIEGMAAGELIAVTVSVIGFARWSARALDADLSIGVLRIASWVVVAAALAISRTAPIAWFTIAGFAGVSLGWRELRGSLWGQQ